MTPLPDDAWVVRGGQNQPADVARVLDFHPSWPFGVSVECAPGRTPEELGAELPHNRIGVTTVGRVRAAGGDVVRTSGTSPHHATLVDLTAEQASALLTPTVRNPNPKPRRGRG